MTILYISTYDCNRSCIYCFNRIEYRPRERFLSERSHGRRKGLPLSLEEEGRAFSNLKRNGYRKVIVAGGEPLLRDNMMELLSYLHKEGFDVRVESNGDTLTEETVRDLSKMNITVCISLDSLNDSYHDKMRGPLKSVLAGLELLERSPGMRPKVHINSTFTRKNYREIPVLIDFLARRGIDSVSFQCMFLPKDHPLYPEYSLLGLTSSENNDFSDSLVRLKEKCPEDICHILRLEKYILYRSKQEACPMEKCLTMDPYGNLYACPHYMRETFIGNITENDFSLLREKYRQRLSEIHKRKCADERCLGFHVS